MLSRTRRLTLPLAALLVVAGCGGGGAVDPPVRIGDCAVRRRRRRRPTVDDAQPPPASRRPSRSADPGPHRVADARASRPTRTTRPRSATSASPSSSGSARPPIPRSTPRPRPPSGTPVELSPDDVLALVGLGGLQLGRHEFALALESGETAVEAFPDYAPAHGVVVDALVELGRYEEATTEVKRMVKLSADLPSLARLSYVRELHGDLPGALEAMRQAADSPGLAPENTAYVTALLGNLLVANGDPDAAKAAYETALDLVPNHAPSIAGLGRLAVGRGDLRRGRRTVRAGRRDPAAPRIRHRARRGPGRGRRRRRGAAVVRPRPRRDRAVPGRAASTVDLELALFEADHGDPARGPGAGRGRGHATPRRSVPRTRSPGRSTASAATRTPRPTRDEALRLGSRDPLLRYHAGAIAAALGDAKTARHDLELALATDPGFSATGAAEARRILADLP